MRRSCSAPPVTARVRSPRPAIPAAEMGASGTARRSPSASLQVSHHMLLRKCLSVLASPSSCRELAEKISCNDILHMLGRELSACAAHGRECARQMRERRWRHVGCCRGGCRKQAEGEGGGQRGPQGGEPGDLYVFISVKPHPAGLRREGTTSTPRWRSPLWTPSWAPPQRSVL